MLELIRSLLSSVHDVKSPILVIIVVSLLAAMCLGVTTTEIIENGFLVLLGYFFGQTISRVQTNEP